MAVWTVFEPEEGDERRTTLNWAEGFVFVPERLSWSALLFAPLVLLRHFLWLAFLVYMLVQGTVIAAIVWLDLDGRAVLLLLVANVTVAVFLPGLRRAKLAARGYEEAGCVVAPTLDAAEQRYFGARLGNVTMPPLPPQPLGGSRITAAPRPAETAVLGLFPEAAR
ncbi:DUF2628 domain-containing protein [Ancylobacter dichloromethanicus]|uniref:DUF2628 domain-containing protein n=1 Tax=Ancylobacter dichloromethanicus TaxID=518825 RepID=A0A9W6N013_9HYPH|nr:DUF2628 domain-containing protein [Ancylobacter dichloromethanicus]MBS7554905.1 DUF2628 domain-containing protein [Ancylobacter dichloromethanicus]GLK73299.1 hypothetical protein GCM10017643_34160 [Ancylobacter dichloromethanicus]